MDHKQKYLEVSNKQRIIDKLLTEVKVQAEREQVLINNKPAKWHITAQCEKFRKALNMKNLSKQHLNCTTKP